MIWKKPWDLGYIWIFVIIMFFMELFCLFISFYNIIGIYLGIGVLLVSIISVFLVELYGHFSSKNLILKIILSTNDIIIIYEQLLCNEGKPIVITINDNKITIIFKSGFYITGIDYSVKKGILTINKDDKKLKRIIENSIVDSSIINKVKNQKINKNILWKKIEETVGNSLLKKNNKNIKWKQNNIVPLFVIGFFLPLIIWFIIPFIFFIVILGIKPPLGAQLSIISIIAPFFILLICIPKMARRSEIKGISETPDYYAISENGIYFTKKQSPYYNILKWEHIERIKDYNTLRINKIFPNYHHPKDPYIEKTNPMLPAYIFLFSKRDSEFIRLKMQMLN